MPHSHCLVLGWLLVEQVGCLSHHPACYLTWFTWWWSQGYQGLLNLRLRTHTVSHLGLKDWTWGEQCDPGLEGGRGQLIHAQCSYPSSAFLLGCSWHTLSRAGHTWVTHLLCDFIPLPVRKILGKKSWAHFPFIQPLCFSQQAVPPSAGPDISIKASLCAAASDRVNLACWG